MARAREEEHEEHNALRRQKPPPLQAFFRLYDEEDAEGGLRPGSVTDLRPQERVLRHTVEHIVDFVRFAVPQMEDQLPDIMHFLSTFTPDPEQVMEVLKILPDDVPMRTAVRDTQLAGQLVEVPTNPGYDFAVVASKVFSRRDFSQDRVQQRLGPSRSLTFQFLRVGGRVAEVFKVLSQHRIQQRMWSRSLKFQLVEVFKVFAQAMVPLLPHRVDCFTTQMKEFKWFFALFPGPKKMRRCPASRVRECRQVSAHPS